MCPQHTKCKRGPLGRRGRSVVQLDTAAQGERLALLNRSQNWLAREIGVSPGYVSMLVNEGRAPSGRIRKRMLEALGVDDFHQLFRLEVRDDEPQRFASFRRALEPDHCQRARAAPGERRAAG